MSQNRHKRQKCEPEIKIPLKSLIQSHIDEKKLFYSLEITPNCNININFPGFVDKPLFLNLTWLKDDNLKTAMADSDIIKLGKLATEMEIVHSVTCYNMTDSKLDEFLKEKTVKHLNVLRGDRVNDDQKYKYAIDLIDAVKEKTTGIKELTIFAAGYPQKHPEAPSATFDYMHLIRKVRAGVDVIITQVVYSADVFLEYLHSCRALTIQIPIIPGLYIPPDFNQLKRMIQITKIRLPEEIYAEFKKHRNDITAFHRFSILFTLNIIRKIVRNCPEYVPGFHFFTLNNFSMIQKLLEFKDYWDKQL